MPAQRSNSHLANLERDGFVVIKNILSPEALSQVREASIKATSRARSGQWPFIRTVGKQFPPWPNSPGEAGIWGVQHLMNPALDVSGIFKRVYFSDEILGIVKELLQCEDEDLVMELFNMLVRPESDFELRWHRDDIPADAGPEQEMERLARPAWHGQYNLALFEDDSLVLVPGSHKRPRSDEERSAAPYEKHLSGQLVVKLDAGDIAFYNNNILHRGVYSSDKERVTLHGSVGHVGGSTLRARNVLQHGVGHWVDECDFGSLGVKDGERAEGMRNRLVQMGSDNSKVGYSHEG